MEVMKYMEVLLINTPSGKTKDVFLRPKDKRELLRESMNQFMCRMTRPHTYLFECRYITEGEHPEFHAEDIWFLRHTPVNHVCRNIDYRIEAFDRLFLCATGFYLPEPLTPFDD